MARALGVVNGEHAAFACRHPTRLEPEMTRSLFIALALLTTGCHKKAPEAGVEVVAPVTATVQQQVPPTLAGAVARMKENFQRVHFAFDKVELDQTSKAALDANVAIMQAYPDITVEVQGHADERGPTDYNLALGERRATSVQTYMTRSGVSKDRITTISFGEEAPLVAGANEVAWTENRRAEFRIRSGAAVAVTGTVE